MEDQSRSSVNKINAMRARQTFGQLLNEVFYKDDQFIIERDGRPMAAVIPLSQFEAIQKHASPAKTGHDTRKGNKRQSKERKACSTLFVIFNSMDNNIRVVPIQQLCVACGDELQERDTTYSLASW